MVNGACFAHDVPKPNYMYYKIIKHIIMKTYVSVIRHLTEDTVRNQRKYNNNVSARDFI